MFPDRCDILYNNVQCPNPPTYVVSVIHGDDEYMVGVACMEHKHVVSGKVARLQRFGAIPSGTVRFTELKPVGTDCIRGDPDDIVRIDGRI